MMSAVRGVSTGPNSRPLNDTVGETGPGIPDEAVLEGELGPGELEVGAGEAVEALERAGWISPAHAEPASEAEAESEAHPS